MNTTMKAAKRLLAGFLSALMALPLSVAGTAMVSAEEEAAGVQQSPYKELATVMEMDSAGRNSGGFQAAINGMKLNLKGIAPDVTADDLALFVNVYLENRTNPGDVTIFEDSQGQFQFVSTIDKQEDGTYKYNQVCWNWNKTNKFNLKSGWNTLLLSFSTNPASADKGIAADVSTMDLSNVNNFRLGFWNFTNFDSYDQYRIRIAGAKIVDTRYPREDEPTYDDTTPVAGQWSTLDGNTTYTTTNNNPNPTTPLTAGFHTADATFDVTKHNPDNLYLSFDLYAVDKTNPEQAGNYFSSANFRFFSEGVNDSYALMRISDSYANLTTGEWQHYMLPWSKLRDAGKLDQTKISRLYFFIDSVNHPEEAGHEFEMMIKNVQIVDTTNDPVELTMPTLFGDGMIFQQNKPMQVWGTAEKGDTVTATLKKGDETEQALEPVTVDEDGNWKVTFDARKGGYDAYTIALEDKAENGEVRSTTELTDVVVGEVWVAGGQSNMALSVGTDAYSKEILSEATNHNIRIYLEPGTPVPDGQTQPVTPMASVEGASWAAGDNKNAVSNASSVGYNFAVQMQKQLDMPVGLLNTALGGSVIEAWISLDAVKNDDTYRTFLDNNEKYCDENWWPTKANRQSALYNAKIGPLKGYNVAGAIWYQGESNSSEPEIYDHALSLLQKNWSETFGFGDERMPFIFAQLAPHFYNTTKGMNSATYMGYISESMSKAWAANSDTMGQVGIYDLPLGHWRDEAHTVSGDPIHPNDKRPVANRMATAAINMVYGGTGETTSPVYKSMEIKDNTIEITFDHVGADGLKIGNDSSTLQGFAIAGENGVYVNAQAEITGKNTVKVWSDEVAAPKNVTYAFTSFNMAGNLMGSDGFITIPFRTSTETIDSNLFHANDWMYADGQVWVSVNNQLPQAQQADFHDLWTVSGEGSEHSYDTAVKTEGKASLKVTYAENDVTIAPEFAKYRSQSETQFANFSKLSVDLKNPDARAKTVTLALVSGGKTYTSADTATLAAGSDFARYSFSLASLKDESGAAVANVADVLKNVTELKFQLHDDGAKNDSALGDVNEDGNVDIVDALMALQAAAEKVTLSDTQKANANVDGEGNVTAADALMILQCVNGSIQNFKAGQAAGAEGSLYLDNIGFAAVA